MKKSRVYIMSNKKEGTLYVGVTRDLVKRVWEYKNKVYRGFASKYWLNKLVYYEESSDVHVSIEREKQLKKGNRARKVRLIESVNSEWIDLSLDRK